MLFAMHCIFLALINNLYNLRFHPKFHYAYILDLKLFFSWCQLKGLSSLGCVCMFSGWLTNIYVDCGNIYTRVIYFLCALFNSHKCQARSSIPIVYYPLQFGSAQP